MSFLSNAAGHLSFPHQNRPTQYSLEGHDETTLTRLLRAHASRGSSRPRSPRPPAAPTLISRDCLVMTQGRARTSPGDAEAAVVEMVMRAERRGLRAVLDPATYVTRIWEGAHWDESPMNDEQRPASPLARSTRRS